MKNALGEVFSLQLPGYSPILVYHCAALCKMYYFYHILSYFTRFMVLFYINLSKKGVRHPPPPPPTYTHTLCFDQIKLLTALSINSFVDISGETYIFLYRLIEKNQGGWKCSCSTATRWFRFQYGSVQSSSVRNLVFLTCLTRWVRFSQNNNQIRWTNTQVMMERPFGSHFVGYFEFWQFTWAIKQK